MLLSHFMNFIPRFVSLLLLLPGENKGIRNRKYRGGRMHASLYCETFSKRVNVRGVSSIDRLELISIEKHEVSSNF